MTKPRIAVIGLKGLPAFGGAATVGENIIGQLRDRYDFTVYSVASHTNKKGEFNGYYQIVFSKFPVKALNVFVYYIKSMLHCLFAARYDLIHLHHVDGAFILPFLRLKYKVVSTSHARPQMHDKFPRPVKWFFGINERIMLLMANEVTAVARPLTDSYKAITRREIHFIPNGISLNLPIGTDPLPYSDYLLFAAGRIIPSKGCNLMLEALRRLNYKGRVLVIGDIHQVPKFEKELLSYKEHLDLVFIEIIKEKALLMNYVKNARLFIYPTLYEAMSIMLLEVAYTQTPVVCSDIPQNTAVFNDDEVTFFRSGDIDDLSEKITFALNNPTRTAEKSKQAFAKLENQYNWTIIAKSYDKLFQSLLTRSFNY